MVALCNRADHIYFHLVVCSSFFLLRQPNCGVEQRAPPTLGMATIRLCIGPHSSYIYLLSFFSSPNLSSRRLDVYHTSTHGVAVVRI